MRATDRRFKHISEPFDLQPTTKAQDELSYCLPVNGVPQVNAVFLSSPAHTLSKGLELQYKTEEFQSVCDSKMKL